MFILWVIHPLFHQRIIGFIFASSFIISGSIQIDEIKIGDIMTGKIDISALNTPPEENELKVAKFFSEKGKNISFIRPSSIPGQRRPDIEMDGIEWEIKCPIGKSKRTIQNNIMSAEGQSAYIIIDLRYIKLPEKECLSQIKLHFLTRSRVKRILVITKNLELVEFPSKND